MMKSAICFGEVLWDSFEGIKKAGGAPMNVALNLHKQGIQSSIISAVGRDDDGTKLIEILKDQGLDTGHIQTNTNPTGTVEVKLDDQGQASYTIVKPVAWDEIEYTNNADKAVSQADAFIFGSLACRSETSYFTLLRFLKNARFKIFDINLRPPHFTKDVIDRLLEQTNVLKVNEHELVYLTDIYQLTDLNTDNRLLELRNKFGLDTICITLGDKGAMALHKGKIYKHPGFKITVADTVGAGDAFLASFVKGLLLEEPMSAILENACATGAYVASKLGANPEYKEIDIQSIISNSQ